VFLALQSWLCASTLRNRPIPIPASPARASASESITLAQASGKKLQDVVVTANRSGSSDLDHAAATVSVITSEEIEEHNAKDIKDALRYEPGWRCGARYIACPASPARPPLPGEAV
jgi:hemoglobin/transferrin/lactoferrin receptor protein